MSPISVRRVYWWTDWINGVRRALRELWRALFGCHHKVDTIRFQHITHAATGEGGTWWVNKCQKCGEIQAYGHWSGVKLKRDESGRLQVQNPV